MPNVLPVPLFRQQSEGDCLPACLQMVLAYWGQSANRTDLILQLGADPDVGTPASRVRRLRLAALSIKYQSADESELRRWIAQGVPVILLVNTLQLPYWSRRSAHAVVLIGLEGPTAYVNDPAFETSPISVGWGDLLLASDDMSNLVVVIGSES